VLGGRERRGGSHIGRGVIGGGCNVQNKKNTKNKFSGTTGPGGVSLGGAAGGGRFSFGPDCFAPGGRFFSVGLIVCRPQHPWGGLEGLRGGREGIWPARELHKPRGIAVGPKNRGGLRDGGDGLGGGRGTVSTTPVLMPLGLAAGTPCFGKRGGPQRAGPVGRRGGGWAGTFSSKTFFPIRKGFGVSGVSRSCERKCRGGGSLGGDEGRGGEGRPAGGGGPGKFENPKGGDLGGGTLTIPFVFGFLFFSGGIDLWKQRGAAPPGASGHR